MRFKKLFAVGTALALGALLSGSLTGCGTPMSAYDIFDDDAVTVEFLKEQGCLFYEDLVFANDKMNHIFVTREGEIAEHYRYPEAEFDEESFGRVQGKTVIEAVEWIGIPSFMGTSDELSLDYSCRDGFIRRLKLSESGDGLLISGVEVLDKEDVRTWFDPEKTDLPDAEQCGQISVGMSLDEVVRKIGKPQRDVGHGAVLFEFDLADGGVLTIGLALDVEQEDEAVHGDPGVYGTHCLYVVSCQIRWEE